MNFENVFLGSRSIQLYHLRFKTPLTSIDCLRGPSCRIQCGHKSPCMPPPDAPPLQQPPAPSCLQRCRLRAEPAAPPAPARHARGHPVRAPARRRPPGRTSLPAGATTVRPPFLTRPAEAARVASALLARALCARHWAAAAAQSLGRRSWCPCARPRGRPRCHPRLACARPPSSLHAVFTPPSMPRPRI